MSRTSCSSSPSSSWERIELGFVFHFSFILFHNSGALLWVSDWNLELGACWSEEGNLDGWLVASPPPQQRKLHDDFDIETDMDVGWKKCIPWVGMHGMQDDDGMWLQTTYSPVKLGFSPSSYWYSMFASFFFMALALLAPPSSIAVVQSLSTSSVSVRYKSL